MSVFDTFSKRKKLLAKAGRADVYQYENLPQQFRVQVIHIWRSAIGAYYQGYSVGSSSPANQYWSLIHDTLARERGVFVLADDNSNPSDQCVKFLLSADTEGAIDIIELSFRVIDRLVRKLSRQEWDGARIEQDADDAIAELNVRFRENAIGFEYVDGDLIQIESQFVHTDAVKPALSLLHERGFSGPSDEFMNAFAHYRHGEFKEAMAESLKAFESTMKAICKLHNWPYPPNATAIPLIKIMFDRGLVPPEMQSHFAALRSAMESGLPTLTNKNSRHGQGADLVPVPSYLAAYALHLVAANIVFLVRAHNETK